MPSIGFRNKASRTLLIAAVFLCMQVAAISHAATYGDASHSHDGDPCLLQILSDHSPQPAHVVCENIDLPETSDTPLAGKNSVTHPVFNHSHASRAPPHLSR
jgi:hypothetical protein